MNTSSLARMNCAPWSKTAPSRRRWASRPPTERPLSKSVTICPAWASWRAQTAPATPAPITAIRPVMSSSPFLQIACRRIAGLAPELGQELLPVGSEVARQPELLERPQPCAERRTGWHARGQEIMSGDRQCRRREAIDNCQRRRQHGPTGTGLGGSHEQPVPQPLAAQPIGEPAQCCGRQVERRQLGRGQIDQPVALVVGEPQPIGCRRSRRPHHATEPQGARSVPPRVPRRARPRTARAVARRQKAAARHRSSPPGPGWPRPWAPSAASTARRAAARPTAGPGRRASARAPGAQPGRVVRGRTGRRSEESAECADSPRGSSQRARRRSGCARRRGRPGRRTGRTAGPADRSSAR